MACMFKKEDVLMQQNVNTARRFTHRKPWNANSCIWPQGKKKSCCEQDWRYMEMFPGIFPETLFFYRQFVNYTFYVGCKTADIKAHAIKFIYR